MRKKPLRLLQVLLAASLSTLIYSTAAQESSTSFEQALKETGWSVQHDADGSLVLKPRDSSGSTQRDSTSTDDQWPQLQKELQAAGWIVERDTDGSLRLVLPGTSNTINPNSVGQDNETSRSDSLHSMQQQLRAAGWHVTKGSDGSILLYPPGDSYTNKARPCPGTSTSIEITLPVDSWHKAYRIARSWLKNQPPFHAVVGKIRKILDVHVVSIVSDQAPYTLIQQIAIRNSDGAVIVLN